MHVKMLWFHCSFDSFLDAFLALREWMYALPIIYQILVIVGLVVLTVGVLSLAFFIIKAVFHLVIEIIKILVKFLQSLFIPGKHARKGFNHYHRYHRENRSLRRYHSPRKPVPLSRPVPPIQLARPVILTKPARPVQTASLNHNNEEVKFSKLLHCPNCGTVFTNEMMDILFQKKKVFCEYCGNGLEYEMDA